MKKLLFTVTMKDCEMQTFRSGGKGGQNQNSRDSGVRIIHRASGAVGEARDTRNQLTNKRAAFRRMAESPKFKAWHRMESSYRLNLPSIDELVDTEMSLSKLKIETRTDAGWVQFVDEVL